MILLFIFYIEEHYLESFSLCFKCSTVDQFSGESSPVILRLNEEVSPVGYSCFYEKEKQKKERRIEKITLGKMRCLVLINLYFLYVC